MVTFIEQRHPPRVLRGGQCDTTHVYLQLISGLLKQKEPLTVTNEIHLLFSITQKVMC